MNINIDIPKNSFRNEDSERFLINTIGLALNNPNITLLIQINSLEESTPEAEFEPLEEPAAPLSNWDNTPEDQLLF